jgi:hypothetical protein
MDEWERKQQKKIITSSTTLRRLLSSISYAFGLHYEERTLRLWGLIRKSFKLFS